MFLFKSSQPPFTQPKKKMARASSTVVPILLLLHLSGAFAERSGGHHHRTFEAACRATLHRSLCIRSLSSFSHAGAARRSPRWWARAALSIAADEASLAAGRIPHRRSFAAGRLTAAALSDCAECLTDAVQQLRGSLTELRRLEPITFELQMGNVQTWVSAALTDEDTCIDGLDAAAAAGGRAKLPVGLRGKVLNTTYYTSNAMALVNSLASAGGRE